MDGFVRQVTLGQEVSIDCLVLAVLRQGEEMVSRASLATFIQDLHADLAELVGPAQLARELQHPARDFKGPRHLVLVVVLARSGHCKDLLDGTPEIIELERLLGLGVVEDIAG